MQHSGENNGDNDGDEFGFDDIKPDHERTHSEIIRRCNISDEHLIDARLSSNDSVLHQHDGRAASTSINNVVSDVGTTNLGEKTFPVMLKLISGSLVGETEYSHIYNMEDQDDDPDVQEQSSALDECPVPTLQSIACKIAHKEGKMMDEKQYITYEIICCTFLLGLIEDGQDETTSLGTFLCRALSGRDQTDTQELVEQLKARGGMDQLLMFLTGPAGAGKSTALTVAQRFCFEFCRAIGILWGDSTFLFTAYTGSAASLFGGVTICKAAFIKKPGSLSEDDKREWKDVRLLIVDEVSFMSDKELLQLDNRLKEIRDRTKHFGGFSIVFAGDFRQLEPVASKDSDLLFSETSSRHWEHIINAIIILDNDHRFKDDPEYGKMLKRMWKGELTLRDRERINTRVIGQNGIDLPSSFEGDACYACPTNKERNSISAGNFKKHIIATHPSIESNELPPAHTIVIEADIRSSLSKNSKMKIDKVLRHRITTTCGDANVKVGTKHIDPALCLYVGAYLICVIGNKYLKEKVPRGNGTLCRVVSIKLKDCAPSHIWKNYYGKKVWTVCAQDVEWIECAHGTKTNTIIQLEKDIAQLKHKIDSSSKPRESNKRTRKQQETNKQRTERLTKLENILIEQHKSRRFRLEPENFSPLVTVKPHHMASNYIQFKCRMTQIPVNVNDATTGHKLQGMSKDVMIVTSWPKGGLSALFKNWEYVVLSRVRTLEGLYLFEPIDLEKSFKPSLELKGYMRRATQKEKKMLELREIRMAAYATK